MPASERWLHTWGCQGGVAGMSLAILVLAEMSQAILMAPTAFAGGQGWEEQPLSLAKCWGSWGVCRARARGVSSHVLGTGFALAPSPGDRIVSLPPQHDGQPYCHKPCYGILFGPKGERCRDTGWAPSPSQCSCHHPEGATPVLTLLFFAPCRCQHRSCGELHLRQRP